MTDFDAINTISSNRSLLERRKFKDTKNLVIKTSGKTQLEFKKVSREELNVIKTRIRKEAKRTAQWNAAIYGSFALLFFTGVLILMLRIIYS